MLSGECAARADPPAGVAAADTGVAALPPAGVAAPEPGDLAAAAASAGSSKIPSVKMEEYSGLREGGEAREAGEARPSVARAAVV